MYMKGQICLGIIIVDDFCTPPHQQMNHPDKKNQQRNFSIKLHCRYNVLIDVYRIFHLTIVQYTSFLAAHAIFSKIYHVMP
jgi:hypothetical protein